MPVRPALVCRVSDVHKTALGLYLGLCRGTMGRAILASSPRLPRMGRLGYVAPPAVLYPLMAATLAAAPPVIETGFWGERIEVGAVEKIGDRYYMLLGVGKSHALGSRHLSDLLAGECGMYVLSSQSQVGPYRLDPGQRLLLGNSPKRLNYFARFYRCGDQLLLNHHTVPRQPGGESYFSPLKTVHRDARRHPEPALVARQ